MALKAQLDELYPLGMWWRSILQSASGCSFRTLTRHQLRLLLKMKSFCYIFKKNLVSLVLAQGLVNYSLELNPGAACICNSLLSVTCCLSQCNRDSVALLVYKDSIVGCATPDLVPNELPVFGLWFSHSLHAPLFTQTIFFTLKNYLHDQSNDFLFLSGCKVERHLLYIQSTAHNGHRIYRASSAH